MKYRIWYSTESFADYIIANTNLAGKVVEKKQMFESDAKSNDFHLMPDHIKQILYLDAPDLIVELDSEPIFSIEISTEAGTGHNVFQRFARLAASVENNVPAFYIYPEGVIVHRENSTKWDKINPLIFNALEYVMSIYKIPTLFYYFPSDFKDYAKNPVDSPKLADKGLKYDIKFVSNPDSTDSEMQFLFQAINEIVLIVEKSGVVKGRENLLGNRTLLERRSFMQREYVVKEGNEKMSPLSATTIVPTDYLLNYLSEYETPKYKIGELLRSRKETIIYQMDSELRGDPYTGAFAGIDYLKCREGKTFEERRYNLVLCVGKLEIVENEQSLRITNNPKTTESTILGFTRDVQRSEKRNILGKNFKELKNEQVPRYYMQVRYGSMFTKNKHIRVFSYFADAILFPDGSLWRDA